MNLNFWTPTHCTLPTMKVTLSLLVVRRLSADETTQDIAARRHSEEQFRALACGKVGRTKQNPTGSADLWSVTDKVVIRFPICARFHAAWKCGGNSSHSKSLDGPPGEDAVWWELMHILEKWAKESLRKQKRTNDIPTPRPKKPMTSWKRRTNWAIGTMSTTATLDSWLSHSHTQGRLNSHSQPYSRSGFYSGSRSYCCGQSQSRGSP